MGGGDGACSSSIVSDDSITSVSIPPTGDADAAVSALRSTLERRAAAVLALGDGAAEATTEATVQTRRDLHNEFRWFTMIVNPLPSEMISSPYAVMNAAQ